MAEQGPRVVTINDYLKILKRRRWTVVAGAIAGLVAALTLSLLTSDDVEASSSPVPTVVPPPSPAATSSPATGPQAEVFLRSVSPTVSGGTITPSLLTENQLISSTMVAERVADDIGGALDVQELRDGVQVTQLDGSEIVAISFVHEDRELAAAVANSFAENYLTLRAERIRRAIESETRSVANRILALRQQRSRIEGDLIDAQASGERAVTRSLLADRQIVTAKLVQLRDELLELSGYAGPRAGGEIVSPALPAGASAESASHAPETAPAATTPLSGVVRDGLAGLILGAIVGVALALLQEYVSGRFRDRSELQDVLRTRVLAAIPHHRGGNAHDGYTTLRAKLEHHMNTTDQRVFLVTSPSRGDGKTTTVLHLGREMAAAGHPVVLVSGDLDHPDLDRALGYDGAEGLTTWLTGNGSTIDAASIAAAGDRGLRLVPAGPSNGGTLQDEALSRLFSQLTRTDDLVLVDAGAASDPATLLMAAHAPKALLVLDAGVNRNIAVQAKEELEDVGVEIVGVVVNREEPG